MKPISKLAPQFITPFVSRLVIGMSAAVIFGGCNSVPPAGGPSGLETRPANSECVAFELPDTGAADARLAFPSINLGDIITGLYQPPGDSSRWYVTVKSGVLATFANTGTVTSHTRVTGLPTINATGEGGLLSMAFHPQFASNRYVFLSYTTSTAQNSMVSRITRYTLTTSYQLTAPVEFIELAQPAANHNGGNIAFGPDNYLYIGFGDGGGSEDQFGNGQNLATLHSKILRINVDTPDVATGKPYSIPAGNMISTASGFQKEIYAQGFRNPWKWSFDRGTGDLWVADVGQYAWEEVDRVTAGKNYGWPITEGNHCFNSTSCARAGLTAPVFEYNHDEGCSITGGFVYRGGAIPALTGRYIYGDYCSSDISSFDISSPLQTKQVLAAAPGSITAFGETIDGEVVFGTDSGRIYQLVASTASGPSPIPQTLSQHPCYDNAATQQLSPGVIPYGVNSELWSDGAEKSRFVAIPDGKKISAGVRGDLVFPVGSVLIKQFYHGARIMETRFLMRHSQGWAGYSYEWNNAGTDATLSTTAHTNVVDSGYTHIFPSPSQCFQCHTTAASITLGPEMAQLNGMLRYPTTNISANQLDTWTHIGLFATTPSSANRNRVIPALDDTSASVDLRARAYLHSNCSGCHRPGGFPSHIDLRYDTTLALTGMCNVDPASGDLGISGAKLLMPGNAALSLIYQRMARTDQHKMPPLGRNKVDTAALAVMQEWISGLGSCTPQ